MDIVQLVMDEVKKDIVKYKEEASDHYDFWEEHIMYVYEEARSLAVKYNADLEIVCLGALLHDIALIKKVGERKDHHINGKIIAEKILTKYNYNGLKKEKVLSTVFNHRSSKNATSIEDLCVSDADILAHFDNIPMLFYSAFIRNNIGLNDINDYMKKQFEKDYNDLSDKTKDSFNTRYKKICEILFERR